MDSFWERLTAAPRYLDQTDRILEFDRDEVERFFLPLAQTLLKLVTTHRCLVAVAGPPAVGKSAFAATLAAVTNALAEQETALVIGLDGWHYPNAYLDSHTLPHGEQTLLLRSLKGTPETFDAPAALATLAAVRADMPGANTPFPVYSRALHDPIPNAGVVTPNHRLLLFEGNYWLLDQPPWNAAQPLFDCSIFLTGKPVALLTDLRDRLVRGGRTREDAEAHIQAVDLPNMRLVLEHSAPASWTVTKANSRRILRIDPPLSNKASL